MWMTERTDFGTSHPSFVESIQILYIYVLYIPVLWAIAHISLCTRQGLAVRVLFAMSSANTTLHNRRSRRLAERPIPSSHIALADLSTKFNRKSTTTSPTTNRVHGGLCAFHTRIWEYTLSAYWFRFRILTLYSISKTLISLNANAALWQDNTSNIADKHLSTYIFLMCQDNVHRS